MSMDGYVIQNYKEKGRNLTSRATCPVSLIPCPLSRIPTLEDNE